MKKRKYEKGKEAKNSGLASATKYLAGAVNALKWC